MNLLDPRVLAPARISSWLLCQSRRLGAGDAGGGGRGGFGHFVSKGGLKRVELRALIENSSCWVMKFRASDLPLYLQHLTACTWEHGPCTHLRHTRHWDNPDKVQKIKCP